MLRFEKDGTMYVKLARSEVQTTWAELEALARLVALHKNDTRASYLEDGADLDYVPSGDDYYDRHYRDTND